MRVRWVWGLLPLFCLGWLLYSYKLPIIQARIAETAGQIAVPQGLRVAVTGRDVVITGVISDASEIQTLKAKLENIVGVRSAFDRTERQPEIRPFALSLSKTADSVYIAGYVDDAATRRKLTAYDGTTPLKVQTDVTVAGGAPRHWGRSVDFVLDLLPAIESGDVVIIGNRVVVDARVAGRRIDEIGAELQRSAPSGVRLVLNIVPADGQMPRWSAQISPHGVVLGGSVGSLSRKLSLFDRARKLFPDRHVTDQTVVADDLPVNWDVAADVALSKTDRLVDGTVEIDGRSGEVVLVGRLLTHAAEHATRTELKREMPRGFSVTTHLSLVEAGGAMNMAACQAMVDATLLRNRIEFAVAMAELRRHSRFVIDNLAYTLKRCGKVKIQVEGHTADAGDQDASVELSQERADRIRDLLESAGVDESLLVARGYGGKRPIASNRTAHGRDRNDRIEIRLLQ